MCHINYKIVQVGRPLLTYGSYFPLNYILICMHFVVTCDAKTVLLKYHCYVADWRFATKLLIHVKMFKILPNGPILIKETNFSQ